MSSRLKKRYMRFCFLILINVFTASYLMCQQENSFSLKTAIDYALKHNANYLNAELDVKTADFQRKEYTGIGLPQISANADIKDYFEIPTSLIPGDFFGAPPGTFIPVRFGTQYNATAGISVSQLIFNSDYIVALQASKHLKALSEKNLTRTKTEIIVAVTKAYYAALINKERLKTLDANITRLKKLHDDTKALHANGFVEKIDLDRIELAYNNLVTEKEKIERLMGISETLLKFQMGYNIKQPVTLTDELNAEQMQDIDLFSESKINYNARPEFSMLETQLTLNNIELKRYRLQHLPSLVGYASYTKQAQRTTFDIFDFSQKWFPIGVVGASLSVPIFNGGQKYYKIQQAKLNVLKTSNRIDNLKMAIELESNVAAITYKNAYSSMLTQKKNKDLAQNIYDVSQKKYQAGVGSNFELVSAETALKEAETNYLNAIYELIIAKTDFDKATGNIK